MTTKKHKIPVDQIQNLEIDRNGRVTPRLNDLDPLENTLLSVLYPGIRVASVNVPVEPLDEYEESLVENALAKLVWKGVHYKLVGASGSAKKGKFYFVDHEHVRKAAKSTVPDHYLVVVSSERHGVLDIRNPGWKSQSIWPISISQLRDRQEALLLMEPEDWVRSALGIWRLVTRPNLPNGASLQLAEEVGSN